MELLGCQDLTNLLAINVYLFYWKAQIKNNYHKIISVYVLLPPKVCEGFFRKKPFHSNSEEKYLARSSNYFHGEIQTLNFKMNFKTLKLKNQKISFHKIKNI